MFYLLRLCQPLHRIELMTAASRHVSHDCSSGTISIGDACSSPLSFHSFHMFLSSPFSMAWWCLLCPQGYSPFLLDRTLMVCDLRSSFSIFSLLGMVYHIHWILFLLLACVSPYENLATPSHLHYPATHFVYKMPVIARRNIIGLPAAFPPSLSPSSSFLPQLTPHHLVWLQWPSWAFSCMLLTLLAVLAKYSIYSSLLSFFFLPFSAVLSTVLSLPPPSLVSVSCS